MSAFESVSQHSNRCIFRDYLFPFQLVPFNNPIIGGMQSNKSYVVSVSSLYQEKKIKSFADTFLKFISHNFQYELFQLVIVMTQVFN